MIEVGWCKIRARQCGPRKSNGCQQNHEQDMDGPENVHILMHASVRALPFQQLEGWWDSEAQDGQQEGNQERCIRDLSHMYSVSWNENQQQAFQGVSCLMATKTKSLGALSLDLRDWRLWQIHTNTIHYMHLELFCKGCWWLPLSFCSKFSQVDVDKLWTTCCCAPVMMPTNAGTKTASTRTLHCAAALLGHCLNDPKPATTSNHWFGLTMSYRCQLWSRRGRAGMMQVFWYWVPR